MDWWPKEATMQVPVVIETSNGRCLASVIGVADLQATAPTREEALQQLKRLLQTRVLRGDLVMLNVGEPDLMDIFGKYKDDPTLQDICEEAYRLRDEERRQLEAE